MTNILKSNASLTIVLLVLLVHCSPKFLAAQSSSNHWLIKTNILAPVWNNYSLEIEYMPYERASFFIAGGVKRPFEDVVELTNQSCTKDNGFGVSAGAKYFLLLRRQTKSQISGLSIKPAISYNLLDQESQTCPSLVPLLLERRNNFSFLVNFSAQITFLNRFLLEGQAGIGINHRVFIIKNQKPFSEILNYSKTGLSIPIALNLGVIL